MESFAQSLESKDVQKAVHHLRRRALWPDFKGLVLNISRAWASIKWLWLEIINLFFQMSQTVEFKNRRFKQFNFVFIIVNIDLKKTLERHCRSWNRNGILCIYIMEQELYPLYLYQWTWTLSSLSISWNRNCFLCIWVDQGTGTVSSVSW